MSSQQFRWGNNLLGTGKVEMVEPKLPIDVIPGTDPPRFVWQHVIDTTHSRDVIEMEGMLPASMEQPLLQLIALVKTQHARLYHKDGAVAVAASASEKITALEKENAQLREQVKGMADRIVAQSELLSKNAEKPPAQDTSPPSSSRKSKG